jgi:hypothetical protein
MNLQGMNSTQLKQLLVDVADTLGHLGILANVTADQDGVRGVFSVKPSPFDALVTPLEVGS